MAETQLWSFVGKLETHRVPAFIHTEIAGEPVISNGVPYVDNIAAADIPVVMTHIGGESNDTLTSPSWFHGRSYVLNPEAIGHNNGEDDPVWEDEHGNLFTVLTIKGNNFSDAKLIESGTAPSGFIPYGLQEGDALLRVLKSSRLMRAAGIDTEWPVLIAEPKKLIYKGEEMSPDEYRSRLITDLVANSSKAIDDESGEDDPEAFDTTEIAKRAIALKGMEFFITVRAMSIPDRLFDLANNGRINKTKLNTAINAYNLLAPRRTAFLDDLDLPHHLENASPEIEVIGEVEEQFFSEVLAKSIGHNLALLHNLELWHKYLHIGNILSLGGIVDLDSVKGEALELDDRPTELSEMSDDLTTMIKDFGFHFTSEENLMRRVVILRKFCQNMLSQYLKTRDLSLDEISSNRDYIYFRSLIKNYLEDLEGVGDRLTPSPQVIAKLFEGSGIKIAKAGADIYSDLGPKLRYFPARDMARKIYWANIEQNMSVIWGNVMNDDGYQLYPREEFPTFERLENGLITYLDLDRDDQNAVNSFFVSKTVEARQTTLQKHIRIPMALATYQITGELYDQASEDYQIAARVIRKKITAALLNKALADLPLMKDVEKEILNLFREKYLEKEEFLAIPDQDLIELDSQALTQHRMMWEHTIHGVTQYFSGVPKNLVVPAVNSNIAPKTVTTAEEVLSERVGKDEYICLIITDGQIDDYTEDLEDKDEQELNGTNLKFTSDSEASTPPTYAFFLIRNKEGSYRADLRTLSTK